MSNYTNDNTIQFEDSNINRWKKFLLTVDVTTVRRYFNHWLRHGERSENMNKLITFCRQYLADLRLHGLNGCSAPAEFNLDSYRLVK